ncbi:MAG: diaminopimelate decarboxylase [Bacteroidota bacterium]
MAKGTLTKESISRVFSKALADKSLIGPYDTAMLFYDMEFLESKILGLQELFPPSTLHAVAMKANPLSKILLKINTLGAGIEVASLPELYLAEKAGFAPASIVFDSPCKTKEEITYALCAGVCLNADSFEELSRIDGILKTIKSSSLIGLRINPQVGSGKIESTSVADTISKFGIPIHNNREKIRAAYLEYAWLIGIHVHIGSQGCEVPLIVEGVRKVLDLANEVNGLLKQEQGQTQISVFDIGGGLPVSYHPDVNAVSMEQYKTMLKNSCKELFDGQYKLITEFGRYYHANAGWVASKVEYVKREPDCNIIMTHIGADLFLRKCYNPGDWHHEITLVDRHGKLKFGANTHKYMVAGPLCFAGDIIARDLELPEAEEGDFLLVHDAGAYTLGMWSRYNSRQIPIVIGYYSGKPTFEILKERESPEDILHFWA